MTLAQHQLRSWLRLKPSIRVLITVLAVVVAAHLILAVRIATDTTADHVAGWFLLPSTVTVALGLYLALAQYRSMVRQHEGHGN